MNHYSTIIIGGGASGLFLAHLLPEALLLEKNSRLALKVLSSGGGKCNFTTSVPFDTLLNKYFDKKNFVKSCLYNFPPDKIRKHFDTLDCPSYSNDEFKVFPKSNKSISVVKALENNCDNILLNSEVISVRKEEDIFLVKTSNGEYSSNNLVIASGGKNYLENGKTVSSYELCQTFGHRIIKTQEALVPLVVKENVSKLQGISVENASIRHNKKTYEGPLLFTKVGISGPLVLNMSREVNLNDKLYISFADLDLNMIKSQNGKLKVLTALVNITGLPKRLIETLIPFSDKTIATINKEEINYCINNLTKLELTIVGKENKHAMVTRGGVDTKEINSSTFESKLVSDLYILGEALDIDGESGGFNITFAFASAKACFDKLTKL